MEDLDKFLIDGGLQKLGLEMEANLRICNHVLKVMW